MSELSPPGERSGVFPLSTNQLVPWHQSHLSPDAPLHLWHLPGGVWLDGPLDVEVFKRCLGALIQRHEVVRTTFERSLFGQPQQRVHKRISWILHEEDLRTSPPETQDGILKDRLRALLQPPFDWKKQPPWRIALYRLKDHRYLFFFAVHHIIIDAWSQAVFFMELGALYEAFLQDHPSPLPPVQAQYADYVAWQRMRLKNNALEKKLSHWMQVLIPPPTFIEGLTDHPAPVPRNYAGRAEPFEIPAAISQAIPEIARQLKITPFGFLLSNFYLLLYQRTRQDRILVSIPSANRTRGAFRNAIGCFAKNLPLYADLSGNPSFADFARQVSQTVKQSLVNQEAPLLEVFKRLKLQGLSHFHAMNQVFFVYQNALATRVKHADITFTLDLMWDVLDIARSDLICQIYETPDGLHGHWEYCTSRFEKNTIDGFATAYAHLVEKTIHDPGQPIETLIGEL